MSRQTVSACLIVRDEQTRLADALATVAFCDEVLVIDGGSCDGTVALARAAGARVIENPWPGFSRQRNVAIDHAAADWILEVDADERLTPELQREVEAFLAAPGPLDMAALPLRDRFLGRRLGPSARYPVYRYRLFRRGAYRHDETRSVHEGLWSNGAVHGFDGDLEHILAESPTEAIRDWLAYARLQARMTSPAGGARAYAIGIFVRPLGKAAYRTIALGGWRDGWRGLVKITLDCSSDALVWALVARRHGSERACEPREGHFGHRQPARGPVRLVALAGGEADSAAAAAWLRGARAHGADVALITDRTSASDVRVRRMRHLGPLELVRALDAETQLRRVDALVPWGARARVLARTLPAVRRGLTASLAPTMSPAEAVRRVAVVARPTDGAYAPPTMERAAR